MEAQRSKCTDDVQEPKREAPRHKDTYRAPRLVPLGTAVDLVQGAIGTHQDGNRWLYR